MRADCMNGHERVAMYEIHHEKKFSCPTCGESLTAERIWEEVDEQYRPSGNPLIGTLQTLLDYEIVGVLLPGWRVFVEYPRIGVEER